MPLLYLNETPLCKVSKCAFAKAILEFWWMLVVPQFLECQLMPDNLDSIYKFFMEFSILNQIGFIFWFISNRMWYIWSNYKNISLYWSSYSMCSPGWSPGCANSLFVPLSAEIIEYFKCPFYYKFLYITNIIFPLNTSGFEYLSTLLKRKFICETGPAIQDLDLYYRLVLNSQGFVSICHQVLELMVLGLHTCLG